jgi:chromosome segregation ATPase
MNKDGDYKDKYRDMMRAKASTGHDAGDKPKLSSEKKLTRLIAEIAALGRVQEEIKRVSKENRKKLEATKKLISDYQEKIRALEGYKAKYDELRGEFKKKDLAEKAKPQKKAPPEALKETFLQSAEEMERAEQIISGLKRTVETQKKAYDDMCYSYEKQLAAAALKKTDDLAVKETINNLQKNVEKQNNVIQTILQKRKINPEQDRLIITWLSAMLEEERKKNKAYKNKFGELEDDEEEE